MNLGVPKFKHIRIYYIFSVKPVDWRKAFKVQMILNVAPRHSHCRKILDESSLLLKRPIFLLIHHIPPALPCSVTPQLTSCV